MAFESDIWLFVMAQAPAYDAVRAFWNARESTVADGVTSDRRMWLGATRAATPEEPRSPGRAGAVFDLLFLLGTTPVYLAPRIDEDLVAGIVEAFSTTADADLPSASVEQVRAFLGQHVGRFLLVEG